jgi:hypothetical protein
MPDQLVENLSGIVLNQNVTPAASNDYVDLTSSNTFYQEFYLPQNYARGTDADLTIPPLTGFQILAKVRDGYAEATSVYFEVQYKKFGLSWVKLDSGYSLGADTSGDKVWLDLLLDSPLAITNDMLGILDESVAIFILRHDVEWLIERLHRYNQLDPKAVAQHVIRNR